MESQKRRPTIIDLAKAVGFSRSTVSRAFNNDPEISPQSQKKILQAAERIGYVPSVGARQLKLGKTGNYGLLLPHLDNPHYASMYQAFEMEARRQGKTLLLGLYHYDIETMENIASHWLYGQADGIVLDPPLSEEDLRFLAPAQKRGFPIIFLHARPADGKFPMVSFNRTESYLAGMHALLKAGHKNIAFLGLSMGDFRETGTFYAYREALETAGMRLSPQLLATSESNDPAGGASAFQKLYDASPRPTAIVCFNDILACGVAHAAQSIGLRIPEDLSLMGGDNIEEAGRIGLSTINSDFAAMASHIYRLFSMPPDVFYPETGMAEDICIPSEFLPRRSIGPAPRSTKVRQRK